MNSFEQIRLLFWFMRFTIDLVGLTLISADCHLTMNAIMIICHVQEGNTLY